MKKSSLRKFIYIEYYEGNKIVVVTKLSSDPFHKEIR